MAAQVLALLALSYFGVNFCNCQQDVSAVINSPPYVNLEEIVILEAVLTNNGREDAYVNVTLNNNGKGFESQDKVVTQQVTVPAGGRPITVYFQIGFYIVGTFWIEITIFNIRTGVPLIVREKIIVKTQGIAVYSNNATLVELCDVNEKSFEVVVHVPKDAVQYCTEIVVTVVGNVMGPTIDNLGDLIHIPSGCGEQICIYFVPNIVVIEYLGFLGTLTQQKKDEAIHYIQIGYDMERGYRHRDGSFSAFLSDPNGSTWLTAYVAKSFYQAKSYITVDDSIIDDALKFIAATQKSSGEFVENGRIIHTTLQGGTTTSRCALTAYITIAFLVNGKGSLPVVTAAVAFLEKCLPNIIDSYELCIVTYALNLAGSSLADTAYNRLLLIAIIQGDQTYWGPPSQPSLQIEATAYGLLTLAIRGEISVSDPVVRWLVGKKNDLGGYSSSQNTVIALEALAAIAKIKEYCDTAISVGVDYESSQYKFEVNEKNALQLQSYSLPSTTRNVKIQVSGTGVAVVQVSWHYCLPPRGYVSNSFQVTVSVSPSSGYFVIKICVTYTVKGLKFSGMGIIEAQSPSGYIFDEENVKQKDTNTITELKANNTAIYYYIPQFTTVEICTTFIVRRVVRVINLQPAYVRVYDYYKPENEAYAFYSAPNEEDLVG